MINRLPFWQAVHDEADRLKKLHESRADAYARSGDRGVFQGQPVEGGFLFLVSVADRYGVHRGGMVSEVAPYKTAAMRIVEGGFELASAAQIEKWHKDNEERAAGYSRRQAILERRNLITSPAVSQVTPTKFE